MERIIEKVAPACHLCKHIKHWFECKHTRIAIVQEDHYQCQHPDFEPVMVFSHSVCNFYEMED